MNPRVISTFLTVLLAPGAFSPAVAHHSFAMFDQTKTRTVVGVVSRFEWTNPHAFVILDGPKEKGGTTRYTLECSSPNLMSHAGWKVSTVKAGDQVTVVFYPLRNGAPGGMLSTIKLPSGAVMKAW